MSERVTVLLGDPASPYPPLVAAEDVEHLRCWLGKHITLACYGGDHRRCPGICALGSDVVDERPCLCPCHFNRADEGCEHGFAWAGNCRTCNPAVPV